jgi:hypothetical protein
LLLELCSWCELGVDELETTACVVFMAGDGRDVGGGHGSAYAATRRRLTRRWQAGREGAVRTSEGAPNTSRVVRWFLFISFFMAGIRLRALLVCDTEGTTTELQDERNLQNEGGRRSLGRRERTEEPGIRGVSDGLDCTIDAGLTRNTRARRRITSEWVEGLSRGQTRR